MDSGRSPTRTVICVGASHRTAAVDFLEQAMRRAERLRAAFPHGSGEASASTLAVSELAVLATCNRVELYAVCAVAEAAVAIAALAAVIAGDAAGGDARVYPFQGTDAVRHLCRVAAGLESLVVGEPEIAGQVMRAFDATLHRNGGAPLLAAAARTARIAGRRARGETAISRKPASLSTVAVHIAQEHLQGLHDRHALVLGAGRMAERACAALADGGARLSIANRTPENGARLARQYGGRALPLSALSELLPECDVVLAITASPGPLLDKAALPGSAVGPVAAGAGRPRRAVPLLLIDLAVPRNIAEEVRQLPGIRLIDIDDLRLRAAANLDERREEVPRVEAIIAEEVAAFERGDTAMLPLIGDLHRHAEQIRQRELARALRGLAGIDGDVREQVEHLSRALVTQLLHGPSARLRAAADRGLGEDYARVIRDLFALDESAGPHDE